MAGDVILQPVVELLLGGGELLEGGHRRKENSGTGVPSRGAFVQLQAVFRSTFSSTWSQQGRQQGLLHVHSVLGLIKYAALVAFNHGGADLLAAVGRQAVQHDRPAIGFRQQLAIKAPAPKRPLPFNLLLLLPHRGPNIGVEGVGAAHGSDGLMDNGDFGAAPSQGSCPLQHGRIRGKPLGRADAHVHPQQSTGEHERMGHVVAITDVGQGQALQLPEGLPQGEEVGEGLAGVLLVGEGIDHRDRGPMGIVGQIGLGEGTDRQGIAVATQHPGRIGDRFAPTHLGDKRQQVNGLAAKAGHGHGEADPGAGGRLGEDQAQNPARQIEALATCLELGGQSEQGLRLGSVQIAGREKISAGEASEGDVEAGHGRTNKEPLSEIHGPAVKGGQDSYNQGRPISRGQQIPWRQGLVVAELRIIEDGIEGSKGFAMEQLAASPQLGTTG